MKKKDLLAEIASRANSAYDFSSLLQALPDPDPILQKTGNALPVYRQLLSDDHVFSCYQSRKAGTLSSEHHLDAASNSAADEKAKDFVQEVIDEIDVERVNSEILDADFYGMSPIEILWRAEKMQWVWADLVGKPPEWFVFGSEENDLRFASQSHMTDGEPIPEGKFLLGRYNASYFNPYGERILSKCFWPVTFKRGGIKFWVTFTERFAGVMVQGTVPKNTPNSKKEELADRLERLVQDAIIVLEEGEKIEPFESENKRASADIYNLLVDKCEAGISKATLGQTLSTELHGGGSYAAVKGHLEVRQDLVDMDKRMVGRTWETGFDWLVKLNYPNANPPKWTWFQEEDVKKELAERDAILAEKLYLQFSEDYLMRTYNYQEGDFVIRNPMPGQEKEPDKFTEDGKAREVIHILDRLKRAVK